MRGFYMNNVSNTLTIFSKALVVHSWSSNRARRINGNHTKKSRKGKPSGRAQGGGGEPRRVMRPPLVLNLSDPVIERFHHEGCNPGP